MVHGLVGGSFSGIDAPGLDGISGISTGCQAPFISSRVAPNNSLPLSVLFAASSKCHVMHKGVKTLILLFAHETWQTTGDSRGETQAGRRPGGSGAKKHARAGPTETYQTIQNHRIQPLSSTYFAHKTTVITKLIMPT